MSTVNISVRIDAELKKEVECCLEDMGMNMSTAINIYFKQIVKQQAIPFRITADPLTNKTTLAAMEEAHMLASSPNAKTYSSVDELKQDLDL